MKKTITITLLLTLMVAISCANMSGGEKGALTGAGVGAAGGAEDLGIGIGKIIKDIPQMPGAIGWQRDLAESADMVWEINKLYHSGVDTEKEMIDYLGLHNEELAEMSDSEFKYAKKMLELAGYEEKSKKLAEERAYAIAEQNANMENQVLVAKILLDVEEKKTKEGEKQLTLTQKKAAADAAKAAAERADGTYARREGTSGTSSMSAATATRR